MSIRRTPPTGLGFWGRVFYPIERKFLRLHKHIHRAYVRYYLHRNGVEVGERLAVQGELQVINCGSFTIGEQCSFFGPIYFEVGPEASLTIGDRVLIVNMVSIGCGCRVTLEDEVILGPMVHVRDIDHAFDDPEIVSVHEQDRRGPGRAAPILIKRGAWIGAGAHVLKGVTIGEGAVVGAGSVVTKDIPDMAVAVGNPARVVRYRTEPRPGQETP